MLTGVPLVFIEPSFSMFCAIRTYLWFLSVIFLFCTMSSVVQSQEVTNAKSMSGTTPLEMTGDIASDLVAGVDRFLLKELEKSIQKRMDSWPKRIAGQGSEPGQYEAATKVLREELRMRIGMVDSPVPCDALSIQSLASANRELPSWLAKNEALSIYEIRWPIFEGVDATGLLVVPSGTARFHAVVMPDAGQTPEQLCGFDETSSRVALDLAFQGGVVVIPNVVQRTREARNGRAKLTDQEFLYRSAFVLGRHIIGYQVQEIRSAFLAMRKTYGQLPSVVIGYGEGGGLAMYAAAVDTDIGAACVSGHFGPREQIWSEPIHRNVHGLLNRFGDAQLAALIAPRSLVIDAVPFAKTEIPGEGGAPSELVGPTVDQAEMEWKLAAKMLEPWGISHSIRFLKPNDKSRNRNATSLEAIQASLEAVGIQTLSIDVDTTSQHAMLWNGRPLSSAESRRHETLSKWNRFQQAILERSATERDSYWNKLDTRTPEAFAESIKAYREYFRTETIGDWEWESMPMHPRTRLIHEQPKWLGYEVVLDVHEDVIAYGTLLLPRDSMPLKNRPCVVFQHGLEGRPSDTIVGDHPAYHDVSRQLVEQGYVVFAPQNLYLFQDRFRSLQRKSNPLGKTLFSTIVAQHRQIVRWLSEREEVDAKRIAFYGLSYGGKSAMRIPALVPEYCLSICSADFNDWVWKNASTSSPYSYVWTNEYEIFEFGLGNHFNYAEMAALIAPRPFMVERGHFDAVAPDERVGLEFAKVHRLYAAKLGLPDRCQIEWFPGPHTINGKGTFEFLRKHLAH